MDTRELPCRVGVRAVEVQYCEAAGRVKDERQSLGAVFEFLLNLFHGLVVGEVFVPAFMVWALIALDGNDGSAFVLVVQGGFQDLIHSSLLDPFEPFVAPPAVDADMLVAGFFDKIFFDF